jgi:choline dehydrogenase-like flavoprotein
VKAGTLVVAAGAIASSRLLQRSHIGGARVGLGLCANLATFMVGDFGEELRGYEGLQIAHYVEPPHEQGYVLETWFDPVVITALSMPGWLADHQHNMSRYAHMMCMGVLVGTDRRPSNRVHRLPSISGAEYSFRPSDAELTRVAKALREAGTILLQAGAERVMPSTFRYREFTRAEALGDLEGLLRQRGNRSLQTAHPQGGNRMSAAASQGVVDPACRVHGYDNLYVCDASVFPTAVTVNPQLTVMALAHHAATHPEGLGALA